MEPGSSEYDPTLKRVLTGHQGEITGLSFHPDGSRMELASSSIDSTIILWNLENHADPLSFENHSERVTDVHFLPNGMFASSSHDRTIRLWEPSEITKCTVIRAHTSAVRSVHADSTAAILSASNDKTIKIRMTEYNNKFISTLYGHTDLVNCARFSKDGKYVVSCSKDKTTKLWGRHSNYATHTFDEAVVPNYVEFHPNEKCIGVAYSNGHIKIYDIRNHKLLQFYSVQRYSVNKIAFHPNGNFFISGSDDGLVKVYDVNEGRVIYTLEGHNGAVTAVTFSCEGDYFATAGSDQRVLVFNTNFHKKVITKKNEKLQSMQGFSGMVQPEVESRVKTSPNCKGILVPNEESSLPSSSGTFVDDKSPKGRISVRIQKIVNLVP